MTLRDVNDVIWLAILDPPPWISYEKSRNNGNKYKIEPEWSWNVQINDFWYLMKRLEKLRIISKNVMLVRPTWIWWLPWQRQKWWTQMTCNISAENKGTAAERFNCHSRLLKTRYGGWGGGGVVLSIPLPCMLEGYNKIKRFWRYVTFCPEDDITGKKRLWVGVVFLNKSFQAS